VTLKQKDIVKNVPTETTLGVHSKELVDIEVAKIAKEK
jgi:hypothetical protein